MEQEGIETFVSAMEYIEREENFGYTFFFVGDDHRLSFVTIANSDNEYDDVSNLDRDQVFRVNIGVSKETFTKLIGETDPESVDYSALNVFLPHPHYARQNFISILNPAGENVAKTKALIEEAYAIAAARYKRRTKE